ncbi:murein L,D-transpeptidase catalytic domain family protein [Flavobacterium sp.]|uniref:murein L,D-transpeptidase catalytic domain family protein n=1 Tax=Flavobacterium sp. TaxID=239 RepID=UPI003458AA68
MSLIKSTFNTNEFAINVANPIAMVKNEADNIKEKSELLYCDIQTEGFSLPELEIFTKAFEGYTALEAQGKIKNNILTIIDFSLSSTKDRMWVIDMVNKKVILQTLVSHGIKSGKEFAKSFSNQNESNKSSLGFYLTGETYIGKHGISLKLDGLEFGLNDKARERAVVIHGAEYVSKKLANKQGYLGRSQGCPAVATAIAPKLIQTIKNKSVLFIYHPTRMYVNKSKLVS